MAAKKIWQCCTTTLTFGAWDTTAGHFPAGGAQFDILDGTGTVVVTGPAYNPATRTATSTDGVWVIQGAHPGFTPHLVRLQYNDITFPVGTNYRLRWHTTDGGGADLAAYVDFDILAPPTVTAAGQTVTETELIDALGPYTGTTNPGWEIFGNNVFTDSAGDYFANDDASPLDWTFTAGSPFSITAPSSLTRVSHDIYTIRTSDDSDGSVQHRQAVLVVPPAGDGGGGGGTPPARRRRVCGC